MIGFLLALVLQSPTALDTLRIQESSRTPHGTLLVEERHLPGPSPYVLVTDDGRELPTQWERVLSFVAGDVVELTGFSKSPVEGLLRIRRTSAPQPRLGLSLFKPDAIAVLAGILPVAVQVDDQAPVPLEPPWTWVHRLGPCRITVGREIDLGTFRALVWADIRAGSNQVNYSLTLHNCTVPVRPDAYFGQVKLVLPDGWRMLSLLPDGAQDEEAGLLVAPDESGGPHIIPRLYRRPIRFAVAPEEQAAAEYDGWGTTRWNRRPSGSTDPYARLGGYLPHSISVPDLEHTQPPYLAELEAASAALRAGAADPLYGGSLKPPSVLWPARGIQYGGGTGGSDITQHPGTDTAFHADPLSRTLWQIEHLRYAARQSGHLLDRFGNPLELAALTNAQGGLTVKIFNNALGKRGNDGPLGYFAAEDGDDEDGDGLCAYEDALSRWLPIDSQHLIRWMRSRLVLVFLDNDPEAKHELRSQALDCMLSMHGKVHGAISYGGPGNGTPWGRGEAWDADCVAAAYAIDQEPAKLDFLQRWQAHVEKSQMPSGLVSRLNSGKVVQSWPLGHHYEAPDGVGNKPCQTGVHPDGSQDVGDYDGGRSNEQCYLIVAHRAIRSIAGVGDPAFEARVVQGLEQLAWATDANGNLLAGVLDRYPCAELTELPDTFSRPFTTRADVRTWPTFTSAGQWNAVDAYDCGSSIGFGAEAGYIPATAMRAFSGQLTIPDVLAWFERGGMKDLGSRANTIEVLQRFVQ